MKRVLLDENLPRKLRRELTDFAVRTVQEEGWRSLANGDLLSAAQHTFDVLLTADRRLQFQQNVKPLRHRCRRDRDSVTPFPRHPDNDRRNPKGTVECRPG